MGAGILIPIKNDRPAEVAPIPLGQAGFAYVLDQLSAFGPLAIKTFDLFKGKGRVDDQKNAYQYFIFKAIILLTYTNYLS